jgi:hypothetical protein
MTTRRTRSPRDRATHHGFEVEILGHIRPAQLVAECLYDPAGERMRG